LFVLCGDGLGGIERFVANSLPLLQQWGFEVSVLLVKYRGHFYAREYERQSQNVFGPLVHNKGVGLVWELKRVIKKAQPDLIQSFYYWSVLEQVMAAKACSVKYYLSIRNTIPQGTIKARAKTLLVTWGVERYSAVSRPVKEHMIKILGIPPRKVYYTGNAIDIEAFKQLSVQKSILPLPAGKKIVGTVANFIAQKNHRSIIEVAAFVKERGHTDIHFAWVGDGPLRKTYEHEIAQRGLNDYISLFGFVDSRTPIYSGFDVFLHTAYYEGLPQVLFEAMASGVPIIASKTSAATVPLVDGKDGLLVEVNDTRGYYEAITNLIEDKQLRERLIQEGRRTVEQHSLENVLNRFCGMWGYDTTSASRR